jgi:MiaB/RimO family radical SAM methylthiotransferase
MEYNPRQEGERQGEESTWPISLYGNRVYIETYGCRYNFGDTAKLVEILKSRNCTLASSPMMADAIIINTCTVIAPTERKILRRLASLQDRDLYVTGCMPAVQTEAILAVCSPSFISPSLIHEEYKKIGTVAGDLGIVQIARGCIGACTYCLARKARGPLVSFSRAEVLHQVKAYALGDAPEIQLTAQDVSAWGHDSGESFPRLLQEIGELPGRFRIRVGMMNPATVLPILDELVDAFRAERIFRFIHLPLQSGSDRILDLMGRGYTSDDFVRIITSFRERYPDITIATDVIVGFPGETDEDFERTCALVRHLRVNKVNITRYSWRPFTKLKRASYPDESVRKARSRALHTMAEAIYSEINASAIGTAVPFIVTEKIRAGSVMARTPSYQGIVIQGKFPVGYEGMAILKEDRKYFFTGDLAA